MNGLDNLACIFWGVLPFANWYTDLPAQVKQGGVDSASAEGQISFQDASGNPAEKAKPANPYHRSIS